MAEQAIRSGQSRSLGSQDSRPSFMHWETSMMIFLWHTHTFMRTHVYTCYRDIRAYVHSIINVKNFLRVHQCHLNWKERSIAIGLSVLPCIWGISIDEDDCVPPTLWGTPSLKVRQNKFKFQAFCWLAVLLSFYLSHWTFPARAAGSYLSCQGWHKVDRKTQNRNTQFTCLGPGPSLSTGIK